MSFINSESASEVLELCKEFKDEGVVAMDLAGMEFEPGKHKDECDIKKIYRVSINIFSV